MAMRLHVFWSKATEALSTSVRQKAWLLPDSLIRAPVFTARSCAAASRSVSGELVLDRAFQFRCARLADVHFADRSGGDATALVDDVEGRPILVLHRVPVRVVVIHHYRIGDPLLGHGLAHVGDRAFFRQLWRVHA